MKCVVCTLFEHHYHLGAAALVNSLCRAGFRGKIYAGFRGPLPPWTEGRVTSTSPGCWQMPVTPGVELIFLALETSSHFTNYKPDFLLQVEALAGAETEAGIYLDPDIILNGPWAYIEEWISCGVALCDDVNAPLSENHPRRIGWRRFFQPLGYDLRFRSREFANGGFIGLRWEHRKILLVWQSMIARVAASLGGTDIVGIGGGRTLAGSYGFADCFRQPDQDALNAALEACPEIPASFLGRQTMGFEAGFALLPHALGKGKPWRRRYLREALGGRAPAKIDRAFWDHVSGPLHPCPPPLVTRRRWQLSIAAALGRFIRRT
jgi:hypothetical protein